MRAYALLPLIAAGAILSGCVEAPPRPVHRVVERVPCQPRGTDAARDYLLTKSLKLGHVLAGF